MKRLYIVLAFALASMTVSAQNIVEKFVSHKLDIVESDTKRPIHSDVDLKYVIASVFIDEQEYLIISNPNIMTYNLIVFNKAEEIVNSNTKIRMYQGGENIKDVGTYTANVFYYYDIQRNESIPESIWLELDNSPNILIFSGIIRINE